MNRAQEAEAYFRRSLAIRERHFGAESVSAAIALDNLAALLQQERRFAEAEPFARRSLAIREKAFGPEHLITSNSLNNLASLLDNLKRHDEAEPMLGRAVAIREGALGDKHPDLATSMHGGIVQQFGTPAEVYGQPANLFVAGFIGSPPMNLIAGEVAGGDASAFTSSGFTLPLPGFAAKTPGNRDVVLGVRPQDLELVGEHEPADLRGRVWVVELLGSEKLIEVEYGERRRLTVQVRAETVVNVDDAVGVRLDARRVHLFDSSSGAALRF